MGSQRRSRRIKTKRSSSFIALVREQLKFKGIRELFINFVYSRWALGLPMSALLFFSQTDFLVLLHSGDVATSLFYSEMPVPFADERREEVESIKTSLQAVLYLFSFGLAVIHWRQVLSYAKAWPHITIILLCLLATARVSVEPVKVVTNTILIFVSFLLPLLFMIGQGDSEHRYRSLYLWVLVPFALSHFMSFLLLFAYGHDPISFASTSLRFGGYSGNPNSLGNSAVLGLWAVLSLMLSRSSTRKQQMWYFLVALIFINSVVVSGSGTALATTLVLSAIMIWMRLLAYFKPTVRVIVNVLSTSFFVIVVLSVLVMVTPAEIFLLATGSMGKDATLTGRTELWQMAREAVALKPWLGWGFDAHASVMSDRQFDVRFNHYHNGYLDTLIEGGIVLLSLVLYSMCRFVWEFLKVFRHNDRVFPLIVPLVMVLILNISEYSLLRPLSELWQVYIVAFIAITFTNTTIPKVDSSYTWFKPKPKSKSKNSTRSKKAIRWA